MTYEFIYKHFELYHVKLDLLVYIHIHCNKCDEVSRGSGITRDIN